MLFVLLAILILAVTFKYSAKTIFLEAPLVIGSFFVLMIYIILFQTNAIPSQYYMPKSERTLTIEEVYYTAETDEYVFLNEDDYCMFGKLYSQSYEKIMVPSELVNVVESGIYEEPTLFVATRTPKINFWNVCLAREKKLYTLAIPEGMTIKYVR